MKTRKELLEEYKHRKLSMGVFQIRNLINGKIYIDISLNLDSIFNRLKIELRVNRHSNALLQKDWNEFGEENFKYEILAELLEDNKDDAAYRNEAKALCKMFIEELQPFGDRGYNKPK